MIALAFVLGLFLGAGAVCLADWGYLTKQRQAWIVEWQRRKAAMTKLCADEVRWSRNVTCEAVLRELRGIGDPP